VGGNFGEGIGGSRGRSLSTTHDVTLIAHTRIKNKLTSDLLAAASAAETSAARSTSHCARSAMTCVRSAAISASHLFLSATAAINKQNTRRQSNCPYDDYKKRTIHELVAFPFIRLDLRPPLGFSRDPRVLLFIPRALQPV
jgi:hypothetical protein